MRGSISLKSLDIVNGDRQDQYGSPEDNFASIASLWSWWLDKEISADDVAVMETLMKLARIKTGTGTEDSFVDAIGYLALAADIKGFGKKVNVEEAMKSLGYTSVSGG